MPKIESESKFLTSIKGYNSVLICQNLPICNPRTLLPNINSHSKFEENWLKMHPAESGNDALTDGRTCRRTDTRTYLLNGGYNIKPRTKNQSAGMFQTELTLNSKGVIYSPSACVRNMHESVTFVLGKLILCHVSLLLSAFPPGPKKPFGLRNVTTYIHSIM